MSSSRKPSPAVDAHPPALVELDRPYFIRWGRRDMVVLLARTGILGVAVAAVPLAVDVPAVFLLELPLVAVLVTGVLFFRNPARRIPTEAGVLVSPADGTVREVEIVEEGEYIGGPALRVGIFLSIFSVHVNRAPCAGVVEYLCYRPGAFHDARDPRCPVENESQTIGLRAVSGSGEPGEGDRLLVRQVSGAIARRILCPLVVGHRVARGGLVGMIKYGSRTELYAPLPRGRESGVWEAAVKPGDRVRGGVTVLLRHRPHLRRREDGIG